MIEQFDLPHNFNNGELDQFLIFGYRQKASDITVQPNRFAMAEINGVLYRVSTRRLQDKDIKMMCTFLYGSQAETKLLGGTDLDPAYEIKVDRSTRIGFRINMTPGMIPNGTGTQITLRTIPGTPPTVGDLGIETDIVNNIEQLQGMILLVGVTGSGKSTTMAAFNRYLLESKTSHKIVAYEAPIEFSFNDIEPENSIMWQTEVGRHLRHADGFAYCVRNALRRKPTVIFIGEARDRETISALIEASLTGHLTMSTVHADTVAKTIARMILKFPEDGRASVAYDLINIMRMIVAQKLVPNSDGTGRVALREYFIFDKDVRKKLLEVRSYEQLPGILDNLVQERGTSMYHAAKREFENGTIDRLVFEKFEREFLSRNAN